MHHNADSKVNALLNSEGFRVELRAWLTECAIEYTDIRQFRLTRDDQTGQKMIVAELMDGRERGFPFTSHRVH